jgi:D-3-phosphoglycerate dehydrogenase
MPSPAPSLLIAESRGFSPAALRHLEQQFRVTAVDVDRAELLQTLKQGNYDGLWTRLRNYVDAEVLDAAPTLKFVATNTTGLTHLDLAELEQRGIAVLSLRGETDFLTEIRATAEHTIALLLALLRKIPAAHQHVLAGGWNRDLFSGRELHRKTVGIIGYGRLGRIVARYLTAFGMNVLATSPHLQQSDCEPGVRAVSLETLLRESQIVSLHANYTPENARMLGASQFALMQPGSYFINTARGELVDEAALLAALESGHLAGAALDVLNGEQATGMGDHPLVRYAQSHDNLLLTPHLGGNTPESLAKTEEFLAAKVCAWVADPSSAAKMANSAP